MKIAIRRACSALLVLTFIIAGLTACSFDQDVHAKGASAPVSSANATTLTVPHGPVVSLPKGSVRGSGKLTVAATKRDSLTGWSIRVTGASLHGTATVSFPIPAADRGSAPVMAYSEPPSTALHIVAGVVAHGRFVVRTTHFSDWWSGIKGYLEDKVIGLLSGDLQTAGRLVSVLVM